MNKTIGILAHVDAGKTTFAEQLLYNTKAIRSVGRVDHKNAFLDSDEIEKNRGITIFSDQGIFTYNNDTYYLIDTPGHIDFSPEMERSVMVMDYAILVISATEGVQSHTETVWQLLRKYNIPTIFFINKIDMENSNFEAVIEDIRGTLTCDIWFLEEEFNELNMDTNSIEFIAERNEVLLDKYLDEGYNNKLWLLNAKNMIKDNKVFPCFIGSALQGVGIDKFIKIVHKLTYTEYKAEGNFKGRVYKIRCDEQGNRITHIKALRGSLKVKDEITYMNNQGEKSKEKVNQIRIYNGNKFNTTNKVAAGEVFGVLGIKNFKAGDTIGFIDSTINYEMIPTLKSKVIFDDKYNVREVFKYLTILEAENPILNVVWDEALQEIQISIMGTIQLEVLKEIMERRFNIYIEFGPCQILYKETIKKETIGMGHFEPLGHYAEVHIKIQEGKKNSGITFESKCHTDNLTVGNQNLVGVHILEKEHRGVLTGSPLTDIKVTLLNGRAHNKHTSGGDFREATLRALRQGIENVKNTLLEPYYKFKIKADLEHIGRIISDIQKFKGEFQMPKTSEDKVIIIGRGPVATFMDYSKEFVVFTRGKGSINFVFDGYDLCHNEDEVIQNSNYDRYKDKEYTSNSIFCSKGQAFVVESEKVLEYMHCLK